MEATKCCHSLLLDMATMDLCGYIRVAMHATKANALAHAFVLLAGNHLSEISLPRALVDNHATLRVRIEGSESPPPQSRVDGTHNPAQVLTGLLAATIRGFPLAPPEQI